MDNVPIAIMAGPPFSPDDLRGERLRVEMRTHAKNIGELFEEQGQLPMTAAAYCMHPPLAPTAAVEPRIVFLTLAEVTTGGHKDVFAYVVKSLLRDSNAVAAVWAAEIWTVGGPADGLSELRAYAEKHGSIAGHPRAKEMLFITMETETAMLVMRGEIDRTKKKPRVTWGEIIDDGQWEGRFAGLLQPLPKADA